METTAEACRGTSAARWRAALQEKSGSSSGSSFATAALSERLQVAAKWVLYIHMYTCVYIYIYVCMYMHMYFYACFICAFISNFLHKHFEESIVFLGTIVGIVHVLEALGYEPCIPYSLMQAVHGMGFAKLLGLGIHASLWHHGSYVRPIWGFLPKIRKP